MLLGSLPADVAGCAADSSQRLVGGPGAGGNNENGEGGRGVFLFFKWKTDSNSRGFYV